MTVPCEKHSFNSKVVFRGYHIAGDLYFVRNRDVKKCGKKYHSRLEKTIRISLVDTGMRARSAQERSFCFQPDRPTGTSRNKFIKI